MSWWQGDQHGLGWTVDGTVSSLLMPEQPPLDRPVGLFCDLSGLWVEDRRNQGLPVACIAEDLCQFAMKCTTRHTVAMKQACFHRGQLDEYDLAIFEQMRFEMDLCATQHEEYEVMSNAILLWLLDLERSKGKDPHAAPPCAIIVTSNPKFGPLFAKLRRRDVFVVLVTEVSGWRGRHPVPSSLKKDANLIYDWNSLCHIIERVNTVSRDSRGGESPQSPKSTGATSPILDTSKIKSYTSPLSPGHGVSVPMRHKSMSNDSFDSDGDLDYTAQSLDLRMDSRTAHASDAMNLLNKKPAVQRTETVALAISQIETTLEELKGAWKAKSVDVVIRQLRKFVRSGYEVQPYLRSLMLDKGYEDLQQDVVSPRGATGSGVAGVVAVAKESDVAKNLPVTAEQFEFVLDCLKSLYERINLRKPRHVSTRLDAAHLLISALGTLEVTHELNEDLHRTTVDIVHRLLDRAPAFTQADQLLRIVGVPDHLEAVLRIYVDKWMKDKDHSASTQAYSFAYRSGLMDSMREREFHGIGEMWSVGSPTGTGGTFLEPNYPPPPIPGSPESPRYVNPHLGIIGTGQQRPIGTMQMQHQQIRSQPPGLDPIQQGQPLPLSTSALPGAPGVVGYGAGAYHLQQQQPAPYGATTFGGGSVGTGLDVDPPSFLRDMTSVEEEHLRTLAMPSPTAQMRSDSISALLLRPMQLGSKIPDSVEERIMELLTKHKDGLLGSDIPRYYWDEYGERLELPENPATKERFKLKDFLLSIHGVSTYTRNTQPVFIAVDGDEEAETENHPPPPPVNHTQVRQRLLQLMRTHEGVLGAQLPSKYLETFGEALRLENPDGTKTKLKEYLLSDDMSALLHSQSPPLKLSSVKAGHDRRYTLVHAHDAS